MLVWMVNTISFLLWATLIIIRNRMVAQEGKGRRKRQLPGRRCVSLEAAVGYLLLRNTWRLCSFLTFSLTPVFPAASVLFLLLGAKNIIKGKERAQRRKGKRTHLQPSARPLRTLLRQLFDLEREVFFRQAHDGASFLIPCLAVTLWE